MTCRIRRVKCDETEPICNQCSKLGRICGGRQIAKSITVNLFENSQQTRSFLFFLEEAAPDLGGYFGAPFWTGLVPQFTHLQPPVRHASVSVGALSKVLEDVKHEQRLSNSAENMRRFSLEQANRAMHILQNEFDHLSLETVLIVSILLVCYQTLLCDWEPVLRHIMSGLGLARLSRPGKGPCNEMSSPQVMTTYVLPIVARVEQQHCLLYDDVGRATVRDSIAQSLQVSIVDNPLGGFHSLHEANTRLEEVLRDIRSLYWVPLGGHLHDPSAHLILIPRHMQVLNR